MPHEPIIEDDLRGFSQSMKVKNCIFRENMSAHTHVHTQTTARETGKHTTSHSKKMDSLTHTR